MMEERNCQFCKYYEDGYCENLELKPCYPQEGCGDFSKCEALEQETILDKIRAEIEKTTSRYTISRERGAMGQVEWSDRLIKESEVLEIIDKYKAESEDKE